MEMIWIKVSEFLPSLRSDSSSVKHVRITKYRKDNVYVCLTNLFVHWCLNEGNRSNIYWGKYK